jgi:phage shock protein E
MPSFSSLGTKAPRSRICGTGSGLEVGGMGLHCGMKKIPVLALSLIAALSAALASAADPVDVDVAKAAEILAAEEKPTVLDVRTPEEFSEGHLEGAVNIDFTAEGFEAALAKLDPAKPYLVHCAAGGRSGRSMEVFRKLKFAKVYHLVDGYNGWSDAGKPVTKGK